MKKLIILLLSTLILIACQTTSNRYTQDSPEIETIKANINDYDYHKWESLVTHYSDTAKIYYNSRDKVLTPKDLKSYFTRNDKSFSTRAFEDENREYEMIIDDNGKTWVNFWGLWEGNLEANNKNILIPVHITYQFVKGKIVKEYGYWNTSELILELQKIEAEREANPIDEETLHEDDEVLIDEGLSIIDEEMF